MPHSGRPASACLLACLAAFCAAPALVAESAAPLVETRPGGGPGYASLLVDSEPSGALLRLDGLAYGRTPLLLERVAPGPHVIEVSLPGHRNRELVLVAMELTAIEVDMSLEPLSGWVDFAIQPEDALVEVDGTPLRAGLVELPVGRHEVEVRRFGFESARGSVVVREGEPLRYEASLAPSPFALSELRVSRPAFNPANAGALGATELSFRVSAFGTALVEILDPAGLVVHSARLGPFERERQALLWTGAGPYGALDDGDYLVRLSVVPAPGVELADPADTLERQALVRLDARLAILPRALGSAGPGLALMTEAFPDPPGTSRFELGALAKPEAPSEPALVAGLAHSGERLGLSLRLVAGENGQDWRAEATATLPFGSGLSPWGAALYLGSGGGDGTEAARAWLGDAEAPGLSGGASLGLALAWGRKTAWLALAPEFGLGFGQGRLSGFSAIRLGLSVGSPVWRLGLSGLARVRLESGALSMDAPRLAAEAHAFLPPAPLSLSLIATLDLEAGLLPAAPSLSLVAGLTL